MKLQNSVFFCPLGAGILLVCPCFSSPVANAQIFFLPETRKEATLLLTSDRPTRRSSLTRGGGRLSSFPVFLREIQFSACDTSGRRGSLLSNGPGHSVQLADPDARPHIRIVGSSGSCLLLLIGGALQPKRQPLFHGGFAGKRCYWSLSLPVLSTALVSSFLDFSPHIYILEGRKKQLADALSNWHCLRAVPLPKLVGGIQGICVNNRTSDEV
ncbi:putative transmembrane protein [Toxoplasma gondii p89]|uniref:Putative transmembrane protein n=1 Tax=Toxoplasma gondii p89 TaxID=943119 RepID=A0A086K8U5_TOXGO|nr:putative transmembrane protein [Toxoplasma gondii p89]